MGKVLIACEESQAVTKEMRLLGIEAFSCDLEPCSGGHPEWHIQGDVTPLLLQDWDMIIAFPPCTHLATSGARHFAKKIADGRQQQGIDFFMLFSNAKCEKVVIENPVGIMSTKWRKPDQLIQPYEFGDPFTKRTCLWLKGVPKLLPTDIVDKGEFHTKNDRKYATWCYYVFGNDGKKIGYNTNEMKKLRSKTFPGIARAMASQWSEFVKLNKTI